MPNITIYLDNEQYGKFMGLKPNKRKEAREEAIKAIIKLCKHSSIDNTKTEF